MSGGNGDVITLPEITIVGDPGDVSQEESQWYAKGFVFGWNNLDPGVQPSYEEVPTMLREELRYAFDLGAEAGRRHGQAAIDQYYANYEGPSVGPDPGGGVPYEELERKWQEAWEEFLGHRHEPHIELPEENMRPQVVFVPR